VAERVASAVAAIYTGPWKLVIGERMMAPAQRHRRLGY
jgi:hypothetical protein